MTEERSLKQICSLLHEVRRAGNSGYFMGFSPADLDAMIKAAEKVYHEKSGRG
jgi:hypothetical protein